MSLNNTAFILVRKPRALDESWTGFRSWLGGMPKLGKAAWPLDSEGHPMRFMAQIDLGEVANVSADTKLPTSGSIAIFYGVRFWENPDAQEGAVVYISDSPGAFSSEPPSELSEHSTGWEDLFDRAGCPTDDVSWPVEMVEFRLEEKEVDGNALGIEGVSRLASSLRQSYTLGKNNLSGTHGQWSKLFEEAGLGLPPNYWADAQSFSQSVGKVDLAQLIARKKKNLERAKGQWEKVAPKGLMGKFKSLDKKQTQLKERLDKQIKALNELKGLKSSYENFQKEVSNWVASKDPWQEMSEAEASQLKEFHQRATKGELKPICSGSVYSNLGYLSDLTYIRMASHPDNSVYQKLPELVRDQINSEMRLPGSGWHQILGPALAVQNAPEENADKVLLAQFSYDSTLHWFLGDCGILQYWISPEALANREFSDLKVTFDSS